jgi:hypothetical protein
MGLGEWPTPVMQLVVIFPALVYLTFGFYGGIIRNHLLTEDIGADI